MSLFKLSCTVPKKQGQRYLIQVGNPFGKNNEREELNDKCWPNLSIRNMKVIAPENVREIYLFGCKTKPKVDARLGYINYVKVNNMRIVNKEGLQTNTKIFLSDKKNTFKQQLVTNIPSK